MSVRYNQTVISKLEAVDYEWILIYIKVVTKYKIFIFSNHKNYV